MTLLNHGARRSAIKATIWRVGRNITIRRPDGNASQNIFGKTPDTDKTFSTHSTDEYAYRFTQRDSEQLGGVRHQGGQIDSQEPRIMLGYDTDVQPGDLIDFPDGRTYHIPSELEDHTSHKVANGVLYTG